MQHEEWTENLIVEGESAGNKGHMNSGFEMTRVISNERKDTTMGWLHYMTCFLSK